MNQINFNQKHLLIFIVILVIVLLILAGLLVYFLYNSPKKNEVKNTESEIKIAEEAMLKATNAATPTDVDITIFSQEELEASINNPVKIK